MTAEEYKHCRVENALIAFIALLACAFTGSMAAALIAVVCCLDNTLLRTLEIWEHKK